MNTLPIEVISDDINTIKDATRVINNLLLKVCTEHASLVDSISVYSPVDVEAMGLQAKLESKMALWNHLLESSNSAMLQYRKLARLYHARLNDEDKRVFVEEHPAVDFSID